MISNVNSTFAPVRIHFSRLYRELNFYGWSLSDARIATALSLRQEIDTSVTLTQGTETKTQQRMEASQYFLQGHSMSLPCPPAWPRTNCPSRTATSDRVALLLSKAFDVLFAATLERPFCHINQGPRRMPRSVFCQSEGPLPTSATIYWEEKRLYL